MNECERLVQKSYNMLLEKLGLTSFDFSTMKGLILNGAYTVAHVDINPFPRTVNIKETQKELQDVLSEVYSLKCSECHNSTHTGEQRTPSEKLIFKLFEEFTAYQEEICDWNPNDQEALDNEKCVFADIVVELFKRYKENQNEKNI